MPDREDVRVVATAVQAALCLNEFLDPGRDLVVLGQRDVARCLGLELVSKKLCSFMCYRGNRVVLVEDLDAFDEVLDAFSLITYAIQKLEPKNYVLVIMYRINNKPIEFTHVTIEISSPILIEVNRSWRCKQYRHKPIPNITLKIAQFMGNVLHQRENIPVIVFNEGTEVSSPSTLYTLMKSNSIRIFCETESPQEKFTLNSCFEELNGIVILQGPSPPIQDTPIDSDISMDESSLASSEDDSSENEAIILRPPLEPQNPEPEELNKSDLLKKVEKEDDRFKVPPKRGFKKVINPTSLYSTGDKRRKLPKIIRVPDNDERARSAKHPSELKRNKDKPLNRDKQEKVVPERIQKLAASEKSKPLVVQKNIGKTIDFKDYCRDNNIPLYGAVISDQESSVEDSEDTKSEDEGSSHIPERSEERPKLGYVPKWAELPDEEPISFPSSDPAADTTIEEDCPPPEFRDEEQEEIKEEPACVAEIKEEREEQEPEESNVDKLYRMNLGLLRGLRLRIEEEGRTGKPPEPSVSKDHAGIEKLNLTREDFFEANRRVAQLYQSEKGMKSFRDLVVSQCLNEDVDMTGDSD